MAGAAAAARSVAASTAVGLVVPGGVAEGGWRAAAPRSPRRTTQGTRRDRPGPGARRKRARQLREPAGRRCRPGGQPELDLGSAGVVLQQRLAPRAVPAGRQVVDHRPVALRHQAGQLPDASAVEHDLEPVLTSVLSRGDRAGPQFDDRPAGASGKDVLVVPSRVTVTARSAEQHEVGRDAPVGGRRGERQALPSGQVTGAVAAAGWAEVAVLLCISDTSSSTPARPAVTQSTRRRWLRVRRGAGSSGCPNRVGGRAGSGDRRRGADGRGRCSSFLGPVNGAAARGRGTVSGRGRRGAGQRTAGTAAASRTVRARAAGVRCRGPPGAAQGASCGTQVAGGPRCRVRVAASPVRATRAGQRARAPASGEPDEDGPVGRGVRHGQATHLGRPERAERLDHDGLAAHSQGDLQRPGRQRRRRDGGDATAGGQGNQLHAALRWAGIDIGMIDVAVRKIFITPRT